MTLNGIKSNRNESLRRSELYYIARHPVETKIEQFYNNSYGITVINESNISDFFKNILEKRWAAITAVETQLDFNDVSTFTDNFLKGEFSLQTIFIQASKLGIEISNPNFSQLLVVLLEKKRAFCNQLNAWVAYLLFAEWLIEFAKRINLETAPFKDQYLEFCKFSLNSCSKREIPGFSWAAWKLWNDEWSQMQPSNQELLQKCIDSSTWIYYCEIDNIYSK